MRLSLNIQELAAAKRDLYAALPKVPAAHRLEAFARGCGLTTYGGLRDALSPAPLAISSMPEAFTSYLAERGLEGEERALIRTLIRAAVRRVQATEASLTSHGYGVGWRSGETMAEHRHKFAAAREAMLSDWSADQFELASIYLDGFASRKTINRSFSSYRLKHRAEDLSRRHGLHTHLGNYVANGMLIAAALHAGFDARPVQPGSLNANFNMSSRSIRSRYFDEEPKPSDATSRTLAAMIRRDMREESLFGVGR